MFRRLFAGLKVSSLLSLALLIVLVGCATAPDPVPVEPEPEPMTQDLFRSDGFTLLQRSSADAFLAHVSRYGEEYPVVRTELLERYAEAEQATVEALLRSDDPLTALSRLSSLAAISGDADQRDALLQQVVDSLVASGYTATAETLLDTSSPTTDIDLEQAITDYRAILAEIHVVRYYENPDKLRRFSPSSFSGSGFLLSERHVVTNYHVIEEVHWEGTLETELTVAVADQWVTASLYAWDSILDVAILELDSPVPAPAYGLERLSPLGDLTFGDPVLAIAHHSGFTETVTTGVVSAPARRAPELGEWIQVDASVTPGASGGMLIGPDGYIHGILVAGLIGEDLNFVVPSHDIRSVVDRLLVGEVIRRPWLGVSLLPADPGGESTEGIVIRDVFPSSPLVQHGVVAGQRIVEINHTAVATVVGAQELLAESSPGNAVHVRLADGAGYRDLWVPAGSRPDYAIYNGHGEFDRIDTLYPVFGLEVDQGRPEAELVQDGSLVFPILLYRVTRVDERSFLASRGVRVGDRVGILADRFLGMTRVLRVFHLPAGRAVETLHDIDDYIYTIERGRYDQNIL